MTVKVTIVVEQDVVSGMAPVSTTWEHSMPYVNPNPKYLGDALQRAVVRAATDVAKAVGIGYREEEIFDGAARPKVIGEVESLLDVVEGGNE